MSQEILFLMFLSQSESQPVCHESLKSTVLKKMATGTQFLAHNNPKNAHKNVQKNFKNFNPCIYNFISTGMNFAKI